MAADDREGIKELLLQDYRYRADGMARSEQSGETRLTFFVGLITFCATAIGAGYAGLKDRPGIAAADMHVLAFVTALALLAIGIVVFGRMITRNESTDLAKNQLDLIRSIFKENFDQIGVLAAYDLFPKSGGRKLGSLTDVVSVVNGIVAGAAAVFGCLALYACWAVAAVSCLSAFAVAVWLQDEYLRLRTRAYKQQHAEHFAVSHAGGVVYSSADGLVRFLVVSPKDTGKDEWVLPKGHIERGERARGTAVREVAEEAGVAASVVGELTPVGFLPNDSSAPIRVRYFLLEKTGEAAGLKQDARRLEWLPRDEAIARLTFDEGKALIRQAADMIESSRRELRRA